MLENGHIDNDFEKMLWEAADRMRGNIDASEYKQVFLGLIFLKYTSEQFERKYMQLKAEGQGFEADIDEYISCGVFYIPFEARWHTIMENSQSGNVGNYIDSAIQSIEKENPSLKGILPKYYSRAELDQNRLTDLLVLFDKYIDTETDSVTLGSVYEYCLMKFAEQEGRRAGEFYTPSSVVKTLVRSIDAQHGRLYDPCCGSGGMFIYADKEISSQEEGKGNLSYYGQDSNPTTWKMCLMNLAIHGIEADVGSYNADTFLQDLHSELKADYILASPPFNMSGWGAERLWNDKRWQFGMPPAGNANYAWLQHMIYHLSPNGRMGVVLSNGALTTQTSGEGEIRRNIVASDLVECIVSMPDHLFYNTGIPVSLWFINKAKKPHMQGNILFVDARNMGKTIGRSQKELPEEAIDRIANRIRSYRDSSGENHDDDGFCALASIGQIQENDCALVPSRYIAIANPAKESSEYEESLGILIQNLKDLLHENHRLERELEEKLGAIGYDI